MRLSKSPRKPANPASLLKSIALVLSSGSFLLGVFILLSLWKSGDNFWRKLTSWATDPQPAPQVDVRSIVIKQVQDASELTTAIFSMEAVVPTQQDATVGGVVIGTTKLLYIAAGEVRAGVDLSKLKASDIQANGETLTLRLPPAQRLDSKIDVSRSSVYDYNRGSLGLGPDVAPQLQTLAQQRALEKITAAACDQGILQQANDRAKLVVSQLVKVPAYKTVNVVTQPPDLATCKLATAPSPTPTVSPDSSTAPTAPAPASTATPTPAPSSRSTSNSGAPNFFPSSTANNLPKVPVKP